MNFSFNNKEYKVIITYKNNKNMYLRIKSDLCIYITCSRFVSLKNITNFIEQNRLYIEKALIKYENNASSKFKYLGKEYDVVLINSKDISFGDSKVFIGKSVNIDNFYKKEAKHIFKERLDIIYNKFIEDIPYPKLRIRKMTSRWGVCNKTDQVITLNLNLIKMDLKYLDYVIIHELAHFIHANHQKEFWSLVECYEKNYKQIRKEMRDYAC